MSLSGPPIKTAEGGETSGPIPMETLRNGASRPEPRRHKELSQVEGLSWAEGMCQAVEQSQTEGLGQVVEQSG